MYEMAKAAINLAMPKKTDGCMSPEGKYNNLEEKNTGGASTVAGD